MCKSITIKAIQLAIILKVRITKILGIGLEVGSESRPVVELVAKPVVKLIARLASIEES